MKQKKFDRLIGRLDNLLSKLLNAASEVADDKDNAKTMRHHAKDMADAAASIMSRVTGRPYEGRLIEGRAIAKQIDDGRLRAQANGESDACNMVPIGAAAEPRRT